MKYYFIREAAYSEETGKQFPQIIKMSKEQAYNDDKWVYILSRISFPDTSPDLTHLVIDKKAKITDVLSASMLQRKGFLMNDKVKNILTKYRLPEHKFYPAVVTDSKKKAYDYFWLQMNCNYSDLEYVDIPKSEFMLKKESIIIDPNNKPMRIEIDSLKDFKEKRKTINEGMEMSISKVVLAESRLDIFRIPSFSVFWIISEKLRNELIQEKITGLIISEAENIL